MDTLASRGWTHVDTEEEAQQARRDVFVRGILIEERNIGAGGATTPLHRLMMASVGACAPLGRVMSFIRVPVKPHPDQVLLDQMYALAMCAPSTPRWRSIRAAQQCHTSALAALCAAKETLDTQKSDERVSVDSLFLLRDRCTVCQTEVDAAKKALDHLTAAHAWVDTSRAAQPSALFAGITLDELVALRDQVHTFRAVVDAPEASLRTFDVNVAGIERDLPQLSQFVRQAKQLQARVAERVEAHASDQRLAEAALQAMKKERHDAGRRCVERGDRDGARAAEAQRNAIQVVADLVRGGVVMDDATSEIAGDEAMLEIRVKKGLRLVLPQAVCAPTEAALTNALAARYFARSLEEAFAGLGAGGDLAYAVEVKQELVRIAREAEVKEQRRRAVGTWVRRIPTCLWRTAKWLLLLFVSLVLFYTIWLLRKWLLLLFVVLVLFYTTWLFPGIVIAIVLYSVVIVLLVVIGCVLGLPGIVIAIVFGHRYCNRVPS